MVHKKINTFSQRFSVSTSRRNRRNEKQTPLRRLTLAAIVFFSAFDKLVISYDRTITNDW